MNINRSLAGAWPYPAASDGCWHEITAEQYWHFLECVPPALMRAGWFACGEPANHDDRGVSINAVGVHYRDHYYIREVALDKAASAVSLFCAYLDQESLL